MNEAASLPELCVAVVGMGLMGGSMMMALKGKCRKLIGVDESPEAIALARRRNLADVLSDKAASVLYEADVVILATPVFSIINYLQQLPESHPGSAIVLDLGSTKHEILLSMDDLPLRFDPLGGHPMCGKEKGSLTNADPQIYRGARFALTALPRTSPRARSIAEQIVYAVEAIPLWIDAETHDIWTASTSHFPYCVANLLAACTPVESRLLVGPGFRSTARLAGTNVTMMMDTIQTNRERILASAKLFRQQFDLLFGAIEDQNPEFLFEMLERGKERYIALVEDGRQEQIQ